MYGRLPDTLLPKDNLSVLSFTVPYGTYQVTLGATQVTDVAVEGKRSQYYLDGIRVYNPLGDDSGEMARSAARDCANSAYKDNLNLADTQNCA